MQGDLAVTGDPGADHLVNTEPLALLIGMLLDQQVPMGWAFRGPTTLKARLGGVLDARAIAAMDPDEVVALCAEKPAIHRFPASMGKRIWELCHHISERYDGDAASIWRGVRSGEVLHERLRALPGYGEEKSRIFIAILAKRFGKTPTDWREWAAPFDDSEPRSVADVADAESLARVRAWKKAMKAANRSKSYMPPS